MKSLVQQARSFRHRVRHQREQYSRLAAGQSPQALFITCSDSRVVPALITQAAPGELFELRTAGNIVPPFHSHGVSGEAATIEFAIEVLKVRDVIVCGHSHCGAVAALAAHSARGVGLDGLPAVRGWLTDTGQVELQDRRGTIDAADPSLRDAVQEHVRAQLNTLRDYPYIRKAIEAGQLGLHGWFYEIDTGAVHEFKDEQGFLPL